MRRWVAVAVALVLVGAGCDGGEAGTTSVPPVSSTAPPGTEPTVVTTTTVPATSTSAPVVEPPAVSESPWQPDLDLPPFPGQDELLAAWAKWETSGPTDYTFVTSGGSFFSGGEYRVFVTGGDTTVVTLEPPYQSAGVVLGALGPMERLFAFVESIASEHLHVRYDPTWGYPTRVTQAPAPLVDGSWSVKVSDFQVLQQPPVVEGDDPTTLGPEWWQLLRAHGVVEATVLGPTGPFGGDWGGWVVAIEDTQVLYWASKVAPTEGYLKAGGIIITAVADPASFGPRILRGTEGERLILLLGHPPGEPWGEEQSLFRVLWAARRTDNGLEFLGPWAEFTTINQGLPGLCGPTDEPRDADAEIDLLVRLVDGVFHRTDWRGDWEAEVEAACNPEG